jgi:hypothetical protein
MLFCITVSLQLSYFKNRKISFIYCFYYLKHFSIKKDFELLYYKKNYKWLNVSFYVCLNSLRCISHYITHIHLDI